MLDIEDGLGRGNVFISAVTMVIKGENGLVEVLEGQVCLLGRLW